MIPEFVAHRGDPKRFPENTMESLLSAIRRGARFVEFDIQLSADRVPVLFHDAEIRRMTGSEGRVMDLDLQELKRLSVSGGRHRDPPASIPTLAECVRMLDDRADVVFRRVFSFVELKRESLHQFGHETCLESVMAELSPVRDRCALISYDEEVLALARKQGFPRLGWVLDSVDEARAARARRLAPEFIFCDRRKLRFRRRPPWDGPWRWCVYAVDSARAAAAWARRGFPFVETNRIGELLTDPRFIDGAGERGL